MTDLDQIKELESKVKELEGVLEIEREVEHAYIKGFIELKTKVKELEKENAKLKEELVGFKHGHSGLLKVTEQLKDTLDAIKIVVEKSHGRLSIGSEHCDIGLELKKIIDRHEGKN